MSLIEMQWERFFDERLVATHQELLEPGETGKKLLEVLTDERLRAIRKFAINHAADSEQPMSCEEPPE